MENLYPSWRFSSHFYHEKSTIRKESLTAGHEMRFVKVR